MILYRINLTKLILLFGLFGDDCTGEEVLALLGRHAVLDPKVGQKQISSIIWRAGSNKAAEWDSTDTEVDYYKICKHKCELNNITGVLKIKLLMVDENKNYSVEINGIGPPIHFQLTILSPVPKPSITHMCNKTACTLSCDGEDAKHTGYLWKENEMESSSERMLTVWKSDYLNKTYTCIFRNPLSEAESESVSEKDLFPQNFLQGKSWILFPAVIALAFAVLLITGVSQCCRVLRHTGMDFSVYDTVKEPSVNNHHQSGATGMDVISVYDTAKGSHIHTISALGSQCDPFL